MKKATYIGCKYRQKALGELDWPINTKGYYSFSQGDHWFRPSNERFWGVVVERSSVIVHRKKK